MSESFFSDDISEFLYLLFKHDVHYMIVGGEAVIFYGHARLTGDIDIFYSRDKKNIEKLFKALNEFWDNDIPGIKEQSELMQEGVVFQFGIPPNRIDLINNIEDVKFNEAEKNKNEDTIKIKNEKFKISYIGLDDLIKNKKAVNRYRDKEDLIFLNKVKSRK